MRREVRDPELRRAQGNGREQAKGMPAEGQTDARYACRMCDARFKFQHELDKHEREQHPADAPPDAPIGQL